MNNIFFPLILMLITSHSFAQTFIEPEPVLWEELKVVQSKVINKMTEDLQLSPQCFQDMGSYKGLVKQTYLHTILWHTYVWEKYKLPDGLYCFVMIENLGKENQKKTVLSAYESKVLISASHNLGFEEAGYNDYANKINDYNANFLKKHRGKTKARNLEISSDIVESIDNILITENETTIILPQQFDGNIINHEESVVSANKSRYGVSHDESFTYPYNNIVYTIVAKGYCSPESATGFFIYPTVSLTNGHVLANHECGYSRFANQKLSLHVDNGMQTIHYPDMVAGNIKVAANWISNPNAGNPDDYGVMRFNYGFYLPSNIPLTTYPQLNSDDNVSMIGYPSQSVSGNLGMWDYIGSVPSTIFNIWPSQVAIDVSPSLVYAGQSGSPAFKNGSSYAFGILSNKNDPNPVIPTEIGFINGFTVSQLADIYAWMDWNPTTTMTYNQDPTNGGTYNLTRIPSFGVIAQAINTMKLDGTIIERGTDLDALVEWESSLDGHFANGAIVSEDQLKASLSGGVHFITTKIDSNGEQGEASVYIEIIRPMGDFSSPSFCIVDIANSPNNTCPITISWSVTDTPETSVVWNATTNSQFATGNSGSQSFTAITSNTKFELYPSDQRKILLDTTNVSAKLPTGNLTNNSSVCSLQPTPIDPNTGLLRDPKATPPGCGAQLSWTNVQWASPSIFYRLVGSNTWQHLYEIPCQLNGEVCTGSINSDEIIPELIPVNGVEFKLLQFNDANSGLLSGPFTITAHRFADAYEFDDGSFAGLPSSKPSGYEVGSALSNSVVLGQPQHNHNFHRPAAYDSRVDFDTLQVPTRTLDGSILSVTVFNMAQELDVDFSIECAGLGIDDTDPSERIDFEGSFGFVNSPIISTVSDAVARTKTIEFQVSKRAIVNYNGNTIGMGCRYNRIVLTRLSGTPSENLTYSVVVNETATTPNGITWTNKVNVNTTETSITKTGTLLRWDSGAISTQTISGDGNLEFQKILGTHSMIGLSNGDSSQNYNDIDYAIYMSSGNIAYVYESGGWKVSSDSFTASDVFRIEVVDSTVKYLKNGAVFYISSKFPVFPLNIDTSLYSPGASYTNISLGNEITLPPTVVIDQYDDVPAQRAYDDDNPGDSVPFNGGTVQAHNFHDSGDEDWIIFAMGHGSGLNINTTEQGTASAHLTAYRVDGAYTETSPGRWDITLSDLTQIDSDWTTGDNSVTVQNTTGSIQAYVIKATSSGPFGLDTDYEIQSVANNPVVADQYDNVPAQRTYDDDVRERPVSWAGGDSYHLQNFHDAGDTDWTIVYMQGTRRFRTELVGSNADTKISVYKWISAGEDLSLSGAYINVVDQFVGEDITSGSSSFTVSASVATIYAVKVESRNGAYGNNTGYKLIIDTPPNVAPTANFTKSCNYLSCSFNASSSSDSDGTIVSYAWSIGGTGVTTSKAFSQAGSFPVTLTVTDNNGATNSKTIYVSVFGSITPDQYDNVPSQRAYNDDVKESSVSWGGGDNYHLHNFHDSGDSDWTIVYIPSGTRTISTQLIGSRATTNLYVYKWISGDAHPSGDGTYINLVDQYLGSDTSGSSSFTVNASVGTVFAVKVKSRYGYYGSGTEYKLIIQ